MSWMMFNFQNPYSLNLILMNKINNQIMMIMFFIIILIFKLIFSVMLNKFIFKKMSENQNLEILWTLFPMFIIFFIMMISIKFMYMNNEMKMNLLTIKITGNQWFWSYEYMNFNKMINSYMILKKNFNFNLIETDNNLILPFNNQIMMITNSLDVIHSWTIPSINIKMDTMPNQLNNFMIKLNKTGLIFGQCSEICGINHSFMPIQIESILMNNFINWINFFFDN